MGKNFHTRTPFTLDLPLTTDTWNFRKPKSQLNENTQSTGNNQQKEEKVHRVGEKSL